jgi:hypothetical protein
MNGFIFYRGPSMIDGQPIVAIATGIAGRKSRNEKTGGGLIQTWIMRDDMSPVDAVKTGNDVSICGDCVHRGAGNGANRSCYVVVFQAPLVVWKGAQRGLYPTMTAQEAGDLLAGRMVRLGSYGDPAAVPVAIWDGMLAHITAKTGYTHQWATGRFDGLQKYCMASCDSASEQTVAKALGWRTFRVRAASEELQGREIVCPASKEAGAKTSCDACKACGGTTAKARVDIAIMAHGDAGKVNAFNARHAA